MRNITYTASSSAIGSHVYLGKEESRSKLQLLPDSGFSVRNMQGYVCNGIEALYPAPFAKSPGHE